MSVNNDIYVINGTKHYETAHLSDVKNDQSKKQSSEF